MSNNSYFDLQQKHQKIVNAFPMAFAFSDEQFKEGMEKLGLKPTDIGKVYSIGYGGFIKKSDAKAFSKMWDDIRKENQQAIDDDSTGEGYIKDMFLYELGNHEYCITYDLTETLEALELSLEEINKSKKLKHGLKLALKEYLEEIEA